MLDRLLQKISPRADHKCKDLHERQRYDHAISSVRKAEYPMLHNITYLDHGGTTLPSVSLINAFSKHQKKLLLANPHSAQLASPNLTQSIVQETRLKVLGLFNASPEHFEVVFVANATAAAKLVFDAFHDQGEGFDYYYHRDCHTSLVGGRGLATRHCCFGGDKADERTECWLTRQSESDTADTPRRPTLFAYPAQSNMNGRRLPLFWPGILRKEGKNKNTYVLLDVAAYMSTSSLDLSNHETAPDFLTMSFYKIFGFPNLGALLVRKATAHMFDKRRYFGGGTTDMITCRDDPWVARKTSLCDALEDGTGPMHSILALRCAIDVHKRMFGGFERISEHTSWLALQLYEQLIAMKHTNGSPICVVYKDPESTYGDTTSQGSTVAFNVRAADGVYFDTALVSNEAMSYSIHLRAGTLCNPAGMANVLGLSDDDLNNIYKAGLRCGDGRNWKHIPLGVVRVSFGACSTIKDVQVFLRFISKSFMDRTHRYGGGTPVEEKESQSVGV